MSIVDVPISMSKDDILDILRKQLVEAKKVDKVALAEHRKDEQAYVRDFKAACRAAARMNYDDLKGVHFSITALMRKMNPEISLRAPSCPRSKATELESVIAMVEKNNQGSNLTLSRNGRWRAIYHYVTADVPHLKGLC